MKKIICWWSGGVTSAVACKLTIDLFGLENCRIIMINTANEDDDTYRFLSDCEKWYGKTIEIITGIGEKYGCIEDVWFAHNSLNVANGAICSSKLKREVRENFEKSNDYDFQVFGFEFGKKEFNRALSMSLNHPKSKAIFPLLLFAYDKNKCIKILQESNIKIPITYEYGFHNNNCFKTGCVQGGVGYWQKMKTDFPHKFNRMSNVEHIITNQKGFPVTMLKDQSKEAGKYPNNLVFLKKHPDYPNLKCIDDMPKCKVEPLFECNGFCGINDLSQRSITENEINYSK